MKEYITLGLMSGTSMDGLDCCLSKICIDHNYNLKYKIIDYKTYNYHSHTRQIIKEALSLKKTSIKKADEHLGEIFLKNSKKFIRDKKIDLIGSHGQTIFHKDKIKSLQIGNSQKLKKYFKIPVVSNFRRNDILIGGNGAPLVPFLDWLLFKDEIESTILINIGGISNISYIKNNIEKNNVIGFDTGPGMCLIDQCSFYFWKENLDYNGKFSKKGTINKKLLKKLMLHPFIKKKYPKSASVANFNIKLVLDSINKKISSYDIIRTVVAFTAESIVYNINKYIKFNRKTNLIISGGGLHHGLLLEDIKRKIDFKKNDLLKEKKIHPDCKEAFLISVLAVANQNNLPANMISVTGCKTNVILGEEY